MDETFIGGKYNNQNVSDGEKRNMGRSTKTKTLTPHIKENVKVNSVVNTDELLSYNTKKTEKHAKYTKNERFNYFFGNMECRLRYKDLICCEKI